MFSNRWFIAAAAIFGMLLLVTLATAYFKPGDLVGLRNLYNFTFYLVGLIFTSQIFIELNSPNQAYSFLTLPVSTLEKLLGSWLLTSPLYVIGYTVVAYLIYLLGVAVSGFAVPADSFFWGGYWESVASYLVIQTIFLWGACYFRKNNFLKTVLVQIVLWIAIGVYAGLLIWILFGSQLHANVDNMEISEKPAFVENVLEPGMKFLFWGVLGPYMLLISYFTLKERQL